MSILIEIGKDLDHVAGGFVERCGERVFARLGDPKPPGGIESHVHWFPYLRFGSDQLNLKTSGEMKAGTFLFRSKRICFADEVLKRIRGMGRESEGSDH